MKNMTLTITLEPRTRKGSKQTRITDFIPYQKSTQALEKFEETFQFLWDFNLFFEPSEAKLPQAPPPRPGTGR